MGTEPYIDKDPSGRVAIVWGFPLPSNWREHPLVQKLLLKGSRAWACDDHGLIIDSNDSTAHSKYVCGICIDRNMPTKKHLRLYEE